MEFRHETLRRNRSKLAGSTSIRDLAEKRIGDKPTATERVTNGGLKFLDESADF